MYVYLLFYSETVHAGVDFKLFTEWSHNHTCMCKSKNIAKIVIKSRLDLKNLDNNKFKNVSYIK